MASLGLVGEQPAQDPGSFSSHVDAQGNIALPAGYATDWSHLGSWAVVGDDGVKELHNVYAPKNDVEHYRANGEFGDGATIVKEVLSARGAPHTTGDAHWATDPLVWFVMVKDSVGRYPDNPLWGDGWGWALYEAEDPSKQVATDYEIDCLGCHEPAKETDWVYVYGYPGLGPQAGQYVPQAETAASAAAAAMTSMAAASGDALEGEQIFARCATCHSLVPGRHGLGPSLSGFVGRKAGSADGFNYSAAMRQSEVVWSAETLSSFLADVPGFVPGNRMASLFSAGVPDPLERRKLVAYLVEASAK
jgi:cytochrome c